MGISPEKKLLSNQRSRSLTTFPNSFGIEPSSWFELKYRKVRSFISYQVDGRLPLNRLNDKSMYSILGLIPRGNVPLKPLLWRLKTPKTKIEKKLRRLVVNHDKIQ